MGQSIIIFYSILFGFSFFTSWVLQLSSKIFQLGSMLRSIINFGQPDLSTIY